MFRTRLISGIVLVALAILLVTKGGVLLYCVTAAISLIGMFELYRVMGIEKKAPGIAGYLACLGYYGLVWFEGQHYVTLLAIGSPDGADEHLRVHVSEIWDRADYSSIFRHFLSGNYAFLPVSGAGNGGRKIPCLADLFKLLGL